MSKVVRIQCGGKVDIPSLAEIQRVATHGQLLALDFSREAEDVDIPKMVRQLGLQLPEYNVFYKSYGDGRKTITVLKPICSEEVLIHADELTKAAKEFRTIANNLISQLAQQLDQPLEAFSDPLIGAELPIAQRYDTRMGDWEYYFHGMEVRFENMVTKQVLDIPLGFDAEWGILDPDFFLEFLESTPTFRYLADLLDGYHDARQALKVLGEHGRLRRMRDTIGRRNGWVAIE